MSRNPHAGPRFSRRAQDNALLDAFEQEVLSLYQQMHQYRRKGYEWPAEFAESDLRALLAVRKRARRLNGGR